MVECDLAKVDVAGSTPVSRSRFLTTPPLRKRTTLPTSFHLPYIS